MVRKADVLTVFVASPSDVEDERARLEEVIRELNITWSRELAVYVELIRWETHAFPGVADDAQAVINEQIPEDYDLFVGIMWHRYGTPTGRAGSGTTEEFQRAKARMESNEASVKLMIYFKDAPISPSMLEPSQLQSVKEFRESLGKEGALYWRFNTLEDFEKLVRLHLTRQVQAWKSKMSEPQQARNNGGPITSAEEAPLVSEDDLGLLDLMDVFENRMAALKEIVERMGTATETLTSKVLKHAEALGNVPVDHNGVPNRSEARRLITIAANDMDQYRSRIEAELPLIHEAFDSGIGAFVRAVAMTRDFGQQEADSDEVLKAVLELKDHLKESFISMGNFRHTISGLPRLTSDLNRAKRMTISVLDRLLSEFQSGQLLIGEAEAALRGLISREDGVDAQ